MSTMDEDDDDDDDDDDDNIDDVVYYYYYDDDDGGNDDDNVRLFCQNKELQSKQYGFTKIPSIPAKNIIICAKSL